LSLGLTEYHAGKTYERLDVYFHEFLTSMLDGGECSASRPCRFSPRTHWIGDWVGPRAGLDAVTRKIPSPYWKSNPGRPVRSIVAIDVPVVISSMLVCSTMKVINPLKI
jgi:hypothetical protein